MNKACAELELPADVIDMTVVVDLARDAAHGVARPAAPLTTFLVGVAVGRGGSLRESAERIQALATRWPSAAEASRDNGEDGQLLRDLHEIARQE